MRRILTMNLLAAVLLVGWMGCDSSNVDDEGDVLASQDVAESVAAIQGEDTGGVMDEVGTIFSLAQVGSMTDVAKSADDFYSRSYDASEGLWTIARSHTRGDSLGDRYAEYSRVFTLQFRNADGVAQKFYRTGDVVAASIEMNVLEGGGEIRTPHLAASRNVVAGYFLATGTDTDTVTVNGNYSREGMHEITRDAGKRTLDYSAQLEVIDLVGPRGSRRDLSQKVSGTIHGSYDAVRTVERDGEVVTKEISKTITIVIENGSSEITVGGEAFDADVQSGDLGS